MPKLAGTVSFLVLLFWCGNHGIVFSQDTNFPENRARAFYDFLRQKDFPAAWQMLSSRIAQIESQKRYATRLSKSTKNLKLTSFHITSSRVLGIDPSYKEISAELDFALEKYADTTARNNFRSTHFTLWFFEGDKWLLDDERSLEPGMQLSQLSPWEVKQNRSVQRIAVGTEQNQDMRDVDTLWLADENNGNPYLRIGMEAGVFLKNRIDVRIRDMESSKLRDLSKILTSDTAVAHVILKNISTRQIPANVQLVAFAGGTYGTILSLDPSDVNWSNFDGRTVGVAGFSDSQFDLFQDRLRAELKPKFSPTTVVNARDANPAELSMTLKKEKIDVLLLHARATQLFSDRLYIKIADFKQPSSAIFMTTALQSNRALAERFLLSHFESMRYFRSNRASAIVHLMSRSPNLTITEAVRLYEDYARELPTQPKEIIPTLKDISLFTYSGQIARPISKPTLEAIINPRLVGSAKIQSSMSAPSLP